MIVLTIRTDKPEAELGIYDSEKQLAYEKWPAHRQLAVTLNTKIKEILDLLNISYEQLQGIVVFKGPGSFTGLRIGATVANALAYGQNIPIVSTKGENWIQGGIEAIKSGQNDKVVLPKYDSPAKTTKPKIL